MFNDFPLYRGSSERIIRDLLLGQTYIKPRDLCDGKAHFTKISAKQGRIGFVLVTSGQQSEQCGLAILYDPKSGLTKGVLHCKRFKEHIGLLEQAVTLAGHPMLLLVLLTSYVIGLSSSQMEDDLTMITKVIEVETGQNLYGPAKKVNRLTIDYGKTTRETNMLLTDLGWTKLKLVSLSLLYRSFKNCFDEIDGGIDNERRRDRIIEESKTLREIVEHQQSITNNLLLHIDSIHERAKNELDIMHNFVAQRESTVMNAIGILTFLFFPGTFIATVFAMPFMFWYPNTGEDDTMPQKQFWLYPVVTLSLTFAVITVLVPWIWRANQIPGNNSR